MGKWISRIGLAVAASLLAGCVCVGLGQSPASENDPISLNAAAKRLEDPQSASEYPLPLSGDALDHVTVRFRPKGSHKTVAVKHDGSGNNNTIHLYYLGHSSRFFLTKANEDSYYINFYKKADDIAPKTEGQAFVKAQEQGDEKDLEGGAVRVETFGESEDGHARARWQFLRNEDGTYKIRNGLYSDYYWSLKDLNKPKTNDNPIRIRKVPLDWEIEVVSTTYYTEKAEGEEKMGIAAAKAYDSYNFAHGDHAITSLDWMAHLPNDMLFGDVNIPGTHDAATVNLDGPFRKVCQQLYVDDLLKTGTRHFDLRFKSSGEKAGDIMMVHSDDDCRGRDGKKLTWETCWAWFTAFLDENPGEFLVFQIMEDVGDKDYFLYRHFENLARQENSYIWSGDHMPTVGELRGKIYVISRLRQKNLDEGSAYRLDSGHPDVHWAFDVASTYRQSDDKYPGYCTTVNGVEMWSQDNWSNTANGKWPYVKNSLMADAERNCVKRIRDAAKGAGRSAICLIYTSCSKGIWHNPHDNAKTIHQKLFDAEWYGPDTETGILCNNFVDEHFSQLIYSSNFLSGNPEHEHYDDYFDTQNVIDRIDEIGEVTLTEEALERIQNAREAYSKLPDVDKPDVTNYQTLAEAEAHYMALSFLDVTGPICSAGGTSLNHGLSLASFWNVPETPLGEHDDEPLVSQWDDMEDDVKALMKSGDFCEAVVDFRARYAHIMHRHGDILTPFEDGPSFERMAGSAKGLSLGQAGTEWILVLLGGGFCLLGAATLIVSRRRKRD